MSATLIPFNKPFMDGRELHYISRANSLGRFSGDGPIGKEVQRQLSERYFYNNPVLLVPSGTAALELALLSLNLQNGDEVIVPSYTFVSCANAVLLAGGVPVFADIDITIQSITKDQILPLLSSKTRAVIVVHYASASADMKDLAEFCDSSNIELIEDAAHCIGANFDGRELGTYGRFGCLSFHETKNLQCGEGGAIIINKICDLESIEIMREKGTNRSKFLKGEVDKYTWHAMGSSYLLSEISAAFLLAQLESAEKVISARVNLYEAYRHELSKAESEGLLSLPKLNAKSKVNGHISHALLPEGIDRGEIINQMNRLNIQCVSHYVPLHSSPFGVNFRCASQMENTVISGNSLIRFPIWYGLKEEDVTLISSSLRLALKNQYSRIGAK